MSEASTLGLPPRERQVLGSLASGDNERQTAALLGLARSTVHEYTRRLFKRYGVTSRSQLVAKAARQLHAVSISPTDADNCWVFRSR